MPTDKLWGGTAGRPVGGGDARCQPPAGDDPSPPPRGHARANPDSSPVRVAPYETAIACLLTQPSITSAAKALGIHERTLRRWMHSEPFRSAYAEARQQVLVQTMAYLQRSTVEAVEVLLETLRDPDAPAGARVLAARTLLEYAFKGADREGLLYRQSWAEARGISEWAPSVHELRPLPDAADEP
jgi:transposase-like protein